MDNEKSYPVIVISGTNASGKSSLGIDLAKKYNGEIISADSRQIYRNFDLCCGKVTKAERLEVNHYMIDLYDIGEPFSVADYQKQVYSLIPQIVERGKIPFLVGGTGLYIDSIVGGYIFPEEKIDINFRNELEKKSVDELQKMLSKTALLYLNSNNSDLKNKRRLIRIIEKERSGQCLLNKKQPLFNVLQIGVTWPKELLHKRIDERLSLRIEQGMINEVENYLNNGGNPEYLYQLGLEYRYILWLIEGKYPTFDDFYQEMSRAIKRFAKQQVKWFKRNSLIKWINMTQDYFSEACNIIDDFLIPQWNLNPKV